jgi:hypothetical protein
VTGLGDGVNGIFGWLVGPAQVHAYVRGPVAVCVRKRVERFTHYSMLVAVDCPRDAGSLGLGWSGASHLGLWGRADGPQKPA